MTRLVLVRHGEKAEGEGALIGHTNVTLSAKGLEDVAVLAASWRGSPPARLVASDLIRTVQSAEPLRARFEMSLDTDARLREMHFGEWEGKYWADIEKSHASDAKRWGEQWFDARVPGGESYPDVAARAGDWLDEFLCAPVSPTIVFSHSGTIRALLCRILERPLSAAFDTNCSLAHVHTIEWRDGVAKHIGCDRPDFALESE